jgi:hypothetical protein
VSGKGDTRRPSRIAEREMARRWARAFKGGNVKVNNKNKGKTK